MRTLNLIGTFLIAGAVVSCGPEIGGRFTRVQFGKYSASIQDVKCVQAAGGAAQTFDAEGIEIPIPAAIVPGGVVKVGKINVHAQKLQEASQAVQALSIAATNACQALVVTSDPDKRDQLAAVMVANQQSFTGAMGALNAAANGPNASPAAFDNAVATIKKPAT